MLIKRTEREARRGALAAAFANQSSGGLETTAAEPRTSADKRKARYQPNSKEVQEFYRVNRYPTR